MKRYLLMILFCVALPAVGLSAGAMTFDGADDYIAPSNWSPSADGHTFSVWFKPNNTGDGGLVGKTRSFTVGHNYGFGMVINQVKLRCMASNNNSTWYDNLYFDMSSLVGKWTHAVFTITGISGTQDGKLYINGVVEKTHTGTAGWWNYDFLIGATKITLTPTYFDGRIGEVLLYNVVLTAEEVGDLYGSRLGPPNVKRGLISRWSMDDNGVSTGQAHANGSVVKDSFGSNDGTINDGSDGSMTLDGSSPVRQKRGRR